MTLLSNTILAELQGVASAEKRAVMMRFFKTAPGEYGEGDEFLGIPVPLVRSIAKGFSSKADMETIGRLIISPWHEVRLCALLLLIERLKKRPEEHDNIYQFYLKNSCFVNNWDLVDLSAPQIVGQYLLGRPRQMLYDLAADALLWNRRIAVVSTLTFIRHRDFTDTLKLVELLMSDKESLMHKAMGWMLREIGKRDERTLTSFLDKRAAYLPRTALRYSLERLSDEQRKHYMSMKRDSIHTSC